MQIEIGRDIKYQTKVQNMACYLSQMGTDVLTLMMTEWWKELESLSTDLHHTTDGASYNTMYYFNSISATIVLSDDKNVYTNVSQAFVIRFHGTLATHVDTGTTILHI